MEAHKGNVAEKERKEIDPKNKRIRVCPVNIAFRKASHNRGTPLFLMLINGYHASAWRKASSSA